MPNIHEVTTIVVSKKNIYRVPTFMSIPQESVSIYCILINPEMNNES